MHEGILAAKMGRKLGRGFLSKLGNPVHICPNLPEDRKVRGLEIVPSLEAPPLRWGGFFQSWAPQAILGWGAWGISAVARDAGSCWGETMYGHGLARGWTEWRTSNGRSSSILKVASRPCLSMSSHKYPKLLHWTPKHIAHVLVFLPIVNIADPAL